MNISVVTVREESDDVTRVRFRQFVSLEQERQTRMNNYDDNDHLREYENSIFTFLFELWVIVLFSEHTFE